MLSENEEIAIILNKNKTMKEILEIISQLNLKDSWLCAGTIRNFLWDYLSFKENSFLISDIDVIFYDPLVTYEETLALEKDLQKRYPQYEWELKNQLYMNHHNPNTSIYTSSYDAISKFPETCTAIGARLLTNEIEVIGPHGFKDLTLFEVRPTPHFLNDYDRMMCYQKRVRQKAWHERWPQIKYYHMNNNNE